MREPIPREMTGEEYLAWEETQAEKFELHHGFAFAFAGGTLDHDTIAFNVRSAFARHFSAPCRTFGSDVKIKVAEQLYFYCDAGIVCETLEGSSTFIERPRIVCEVLSPRTRGYDVVEKRAAYRALPSLHAYVIVHTEARRVQVDTRDLAGRWQTHWYDDEPILIDGLTLSAGEIYARSSLNDSETGLP